MALSALDEIRKLFDKARNSRFITKPIVSAVPKRPIDTYNKTLQQSRKRLAQGKQLKNTYSPLTRYAQLPHVTAGANVQRSVQQAGRNFAGNVKILSTPEGTEQWLGGFDPGTAEKPNYLNLAAGTLIDKGGTAGALQIPTLAKRTFGRNDSLANRGMSALQLAGNTAGFLLPGIDDAAYAGYDYLKGTVQAGRQGMTGQQSRFEGLKTLAGQQRVGLGDAATDNPQLAQIGNFLEIPAVLLAGYKLNKRQAENVIKNQLAKRILELDPSLDSKGAKHAANQFWTDEFKNVHSTLTGRFSKKKITPQVPKNEPIYYGELRKRMGYSRDDLGNILVGINGKQVKLSDIPKQKGVFARIPGVDPDPGVDKATRGAFTRIKDLQARKANVAKGSIGDLSKQRPGEAGGINFGAKIGADPDPGVTKATKGAFARIKDLQARKGQIKLPVSGDIKKVEQQIDDLIGYSSQGLHWKQEYGLRNQFIDAAKEQAPPKVIRQIEKLEKMLDGVRLKREQVDTVVRQAKDLQLKKVEQPKTIKIASRQKPLVSDQLSLRASTKSKQAQQAVKRSLEEQNLYKTVPSQKRNTFGKSIPSDEIYKIDKAVEVGREATPVTKKVNVLDYFRTPDRVLNKIGLRREAQFLRQKYNDYLDELPKNIDKITQWSKQVPKESNERIFKYLDGQKIALSKQEARVAGEIKEYLSKWADRLGLPKDRRIAHYITHIFEPDFIKKEFDEELAAMIKDKVPSSVYDPFLQKRLGKMGFVEDTWRALDAYTKRATRKFHMDQALKKIEAKSGSLEDSQLNYVKGLTARINLRPTQLDTLVDNLVKSIPGVGYRLGQRPVNALSRTGRQMIYRGALGLNVSSALKNLTQGANTYAKLGEKYTAKGYMRLLKNWNSGELEKVGVLRDNFIQDRTLSATKKTIERIDKGLFSLFESVEKINRGSAYFGAKARALEKGLSEEQAIKAGVDLARDTQFTFGSVDTPMVLQSDIAKTIGQFQSFTIKQAEFLSEMVKNKEFAGIIRWTGASLAMVYSFGELIGMEPKDLIPSFRISTPPTLKTPVEIGKSLLNTPDRYGNERDTEDKLRDIGKTVVPFIPAGVQGKKTIEGVGAVNKGASTTRTGRVRYPIEQEPKDYLRAGLFGQYSFPQARQYFNNNETPLGPKQSEALLKSGNKTEEFKKVREIQELKKQNVILREAQKSQVEKLYNTVKTAPTNEAKIRALRSLKDNPELIKEFRKYAKEKSAPTFSLTATETGLKSSPIKVRAKYIKREIQQAKTREEKIRLLKNYYDKGILTKDVVGAMKQGEQLKVTTRENSDFPFPDYSSSTPGQVLRADLEFNGKGNADIVFHMRTPDGKIINVPQTKETYTGEKSYYGLELKIPQGTTAGTGEVWVTVNGKEVPGTRKSHNIIQGQAVNRYSNYKDIN